MMKAIALVAALQSFVGAVPLQSNPPQSLPAVVLSDLTNVPNPVDTRKPGIEGQTQISYTLTSDSPVSVTLYDLLGMRVRGWTFVAGQEGGRAGANHLLWDGSNESGRKVAKGGYVLLVETHAEGLSASAYRKIGVIH